MFKDIRVQAAIQTLLIIVLGLIAMFSVAYIIHIVPGEILWYVFFVGWAVFMTNLLYGMVRDNLVIKAAIKASEAHDDSLRAGQ